MGQSETDRAANAQRTTLTSTIGHSGGEPSGETVGSIAIEKLAYSVGEAAASTGISRSLIWELLRSGEIKSFRPNGRRRRLIYVDDLRHWLLRQREGETRVRAATSQ
jgi:excisionase family DNA binding protein